MARPKLSVERPQMGVKEMKKRLPLIGLAGGVAVLSSGCTLSEISLVLQVLRALGII